MIFCFFVFFSSRGAPSRTPGRGGSSHSNSNTNMTVEDENAGADNLIKKLETELSQNIEIWI